MDFPPPAHDACALQMKRKSKLQKKNAANTTMAATAAREANDDVAASSVAAPVGSGTDPLPAGRCRRSCRTPTAQVHSNRPLHRSAPAAPDGAAPAERRTGQKRKASSSPDVCLKLLARAATTTTLCTHAPMHRALTRTALWGRLPPRRSQRPRPSRSGRGLCPCLTCALRPHPGHASHMQAAPSCAACTLDRHI